MKYLKSFNTKIGLMQIIEEDGKIIELNWNNKKYDENEIKQKDTDILLEAKKQINEYLERTRKEFDLPLNPRGTDFMKKVWKELLNIPYGNTTTYKQIAENIGNPKAARAVGMANNKNPIPIIIPCHRVIGSSGNLVGYALGLDKKNFLLELEK